MKKSSGAMRSQSAMEYLMTYGWAILIIAVILGALYQVGVFNPYTFSPKVGAGACKIARGIVDGQVTSSKVGTCDNALPQYVASFSSSSYVIANGVALPSGDGPRAVTGWLMYTSLPNTNTNVYSFYGVATTQNAFGGWISGSSSNCGAPAFSMVVDSWGCYTATGSTTSADEWIFFANIYDGSNIASYVGKAGTLYSASSADAGATTAAQTPFYINYASPSGWPGINGYMADIQVYNASLSSNEVTALYKEGIGGAPIKTANLVGWWPLNGDAKDYSGNSNDGATAGVTFTGSWMNGYSTP